MASTITYQVIGTYTPFMVVLRDDISGTVINSNVVHESGVDKTFTDVPVGDYVVETNDSAGGFDVSDPILIV